MTNQQMQMYRESLFKATQLLHNSTNQNPKWEFVLCSWGRQLLLQCFSPPGVERGTRGNQTNAGGGGITVHLVTLSYKEHSSKMLIL